MLPSQEGLAQASLAWRGFSHPWLWTPPSHTHLPTIHWRTRLCITPSTLESRVLNTESPGPGQRILPARGQCTQQSHQALAQADCLRTVAALSAPHPRKTQLKTGPQGPARRVTASLKTQKSVHPQDAGRLGSVFIHTATQLVRILSIALNKWLLSKQASASQGVNVKDRHFNMGRGEGTGNTSPHAGTRTRAPAPLPAPRRRPCLSHRPRCPRPPRAHSSAPLLQRDPLGASTLGCFTLHSWLLWAVSETAQVLMGPALVFPQPISTYTGPATCGAWGLPESSSEALRASSLQQLLWGPPPRSARRGTSPEEGAGWVPPVCPRPREHRIGPTRGCELQAEVQPLAQVPGQAVRSGPGHRV